MNFPSFSADDIIYILGGGPSLLNGLQKIGNDKRQKKVIAVNDAIYAYPGSDLLFFRDPNWYLKNRNTVESRKEMVVTSRLAPYYSKNVFVVNTMHCLDFITSTNFESEGYTIKYGRSGGHLALSLAIALGAKNCILLGFDCREVDGKTHFSRIEDNTLPVMLKNDFLPAWDGWGAAVDRADVSVLNATTNSAIKEFPFYQPDEAIQC